MSIPGSDVSDTAPIGDRRAGRPRSFELDSALDSAVDLFWERGYRRTTTRDLERHLGIGQSSLSHNFGTKRDLLLSAVDRYEARMEADLFPILDSPNAGLDALDGFFETLGEWIESNRSRGCLVINLMASEADDPVIGRRVRAYRELIRSSLRKPLDRALPSEAASRAELLTAAVMGVHVTARSSDRQSEVDAMVAAIRDQIARWRP